MSDHSWRQLLQLAGNSGSTDTIEQCRTCGVVRHVYTYTTLKQQLSTARSYSLAEPVPTDDECRGLLGMLPAAADVPSAAEPVL